MADVPQDDKQPNTETQTKCITLSYLVTSKWNDISGD